jgi:predicted molibdopterin-dependent oxidoreductase YjgC
LSHETTGDKQVTFTIDGTSVTASDTTTILEAATSVGIHIPTLCYHARMTPIGSCRVCLVRIDGNDTPVASCATPVSEGIAITTNDKEISRLRRQAVQFLLLNHPLECPVCDKAGECELQDITYKLDVHKQEYDTAPATWDSDTDSPLIFRSDGRCIRCGRCVAICDEVQDAGAIDFVNRGYDTKISPTNGDTLDCEFCGQCVSVCPVGALLPKPFLNKIRVWDVDGTDTVCAFCAAGCALTAHTHDGSVYRVVSDRESTHNKGDLCARGTFGFQFVESDKRGKSAFEKTDGNTVAIGTDEAIEKAAAQLKQIVDKHGASSVAAIGSARMLNEAAFAFAWFMKKVVGTPHIDTEAGLGYRQMHEALYGGPVGTFDDLENCDATLVFGSDLGVEMPVPALRIIAAAKKHDAKVVTAAPYRTKLHKSSVGSLVYAAGTESALALAMAKIALDNNWVPDSVCENVDFAQVTMGMNYDVDALCKSAGLDRQQVESATKTLFSGTRRAVVVGPYAYTNAKARQATALLCRLVGPEVFLVSSDRGNAQGVTDVGCTPGADGKDYAEILDGIEKGQIKALWVAGSDPVALFAKYADSLDKLALLVVQDPFVSKTAEKADYFLPAASWGQKGGTCASAEGRFQRVNEFLPLNRFAKTDSDIFAQAGKCFDANADISIDLVEDDQEFVGRTMTTKIPKAPATPSGKTGDFMLVRGASLYMNGTISTHCRHLLTICPEAYVALSPQKMEALGARQGDRISILAGGVSVDVSVKADKSIPVNVGLVIDHFAESGVTALFDKNENVVAASIGSVMKSSD